MVEDRNRSLPGAEVSDNGSKELITCLKQLFVIFDVSDELSSDEGTETLSHKTQTFPKIEECSLQHLSCRNWRENCQTTNSDDTDRSEILDTGEFHRAKALIS